jgi:hypothetical protein
MYVKGDLRPYRQLSQELATETVLLLVFSKKLVLTYSKVYLSLVCKRGRGYRI